MKNMLFVTALVLLIAGTAFSQQKTGGFETPDMSKWVGSEIGNPYSPKTIVPKDDLSPQVQELQAQLRAAKLSGQSNRCIEIEKQIDALVGTSVTKKPAPYPGGYRYVGLPVTVDNVTNNRLFATPPGTSTKAMCTYTEQRGLNSGRIWVFVGYGTASGSPDSIRAFFSDNNGTSWTFHSLYWLGNQDKIRNDEMDLEVIEQNTGDKYMWLVYGINASNGKTLDGMIIIEEPTSFYVGEWAFAWPGENFSATNYFVYKPRVTSDNANYYTSSNSWLFVASSFDSLTTGTTHYGAQKICYVVNPFTTTPTITYRSTPIYWNCTTTQYDLQTDIQYYQHNGVDSLFVTWTNSACSPDYIYSSRFNETPNVNAPGVGPTLSLGQTTYAKQFARIAGNGGAELMIVCRQNWSNNGDWDIAFTKSVDGGNTWTYNFIDSRTDATNYPLQPEITGKKNPTATGDYKVSYFVTGYDSVYTAYCPGSGSNGWSSYSAVNYVAASTSETGPKPTFSNFPNDSCVTFYPEFGPVNLWAARGCSGTIMTGIENNTNQVPVGYKLTQNYPNPFNPTTNIKFNLPLTGYVKLAVYDVLGNQVATLIDGETEGGVHSINFDASNLASGVYFYKLEANGFSDVKKMMLIK